MQKDFLMAISTKKIKREIQNICDSYSNPWDIFSELTQNSIDAITKWNLQNRELKRDHRIVIEIDRDLRRICIEDTGVGFNPENAATMLAPNSGDKDGELETIGEKGVGLTFSIFSSNLFQLDTQSVFGRYHAEVRNANTWKSNQDTSSGSVPQIENERSELANVDPSETFSRINLESVELFADEESLNFFRMSPQRIIYYLRTKTAIGSTKKRFDKGSLDVKVSLRISSSGNIEFDNLVMAEYLFPDEFVSKNDVVDLDDYDKISGSLSDEKKRKKLQGKCLKIEGKEDRYHYFFFFVPNLEMWNTISKRSELFFPYGDDNYRLDVSHQLTVSTKGMPTSFEISQPATGASGYWNNLFGIVEYDNIRFDIGRKFIHGRVLNPIRELIRKKFLRLANLKQFVAKDKSPSPIPFGSNTMYAREKEFDKIKSEVPNLDFERINYLKFPDDQEAAVAAIFHELLGSGVLKGYFGLREGYKQNYDFWGIYRLDGSNLGKNVRNNLGPGIVDHPVVIEYKYECASVISDVRENIKRFLEIDLLVCWQIDEADFKKNGIDVGVIHPDDIYYFGSNYILDWPSTYDLGKDSRKPVLALKTFLEDYKRKH